MVVRTGPTRRGKMNAKPPCLSENEPLPTHMLKSPLRSSLLLLFVVSLGGASLPLSAQSVDAVVEQMRAQQTQQLEAVDTYIVETNHYTSYSKKVVRDGEPTYDTETQMKGSDTPGFASAGTPSTAYGLHFDQLKAEASYTGTKMVDGTTCHVLKVDNPSAVNAALGGETKSLTYYIDAEQYVPRRMVVESNAQGTQGDGAGTIIINMTQYRTTDGLTLPHRMEIQLDMAMSEQQRQQMEQLMKQMQDMPEEQRQKMEKMMGGQMQKMKQMMSGEPIIVEVQNVHVNTELPAGVF